MPLRFLKKPGMELTPSEKRVGLAILLVLLMTAAAGAWAGAPELSALTLLPLVILVGMMQAGRSANSPLHPAAPATNSRPGVPSIAEQDELCLALPSESISFDASDRGTPPVSAAESGSAGKWSTDSQELDRDRLVQAVLQSESVTSMEPPAEANASAYAGCGR